MDNEQQPTYEQLQAQVKHQQELIQALQGEVGALTGDKISVAIAYQDARKQLDTLIDDKTK